jgi:HAD superfamily phosphoserine phosphatase-like hydrolase
MSIVVFDLCGTLYNSNTTFDFLDFYFQNDARYLKYRQLFKTFPLRVFNSLSRRLIKREYIRSRLIRFLKGRSKEDLTESARRFLQDYLSGKRIAATHDLLQSFRSKNMRLVLMSASLDFIVETVAIELNFADFHATSLSYFDGICTGVILRDLLYEKPRVFSNVYGHSKPAVVVTDDRLDRDLVRQAAKAYIVPQLSDERYWLREFPNITLLDRKAGQGFSAASLES